MPNPVLGEKTFIQFAGTADRGETMTIQGTVNKTLVLLALVAVSAIWSWDKIMSGDAALTPWLSVSATGGFIVAMVTTFKKDWSPVTAPLYALLEGVVLGGLSALFEHEFPGIVLQAVGLTFGILFTLLAAYLSGLVKATDNFKLGVVAATGGICLIYLATFILGLFGLHMPYIHDNGWIGIGFSLFVVFIAALNLVIDFDIIETGVKAGAPKFLEWYGAFAVMVTLIWLYLEILRLLAKARSRRN